MGLTGCGVVFDDLPPCPPQPPIYQGAEVRFVYTHNLESANAFPAQIDCLTLHIFTADGTFVRTVSETSRALLGDEDWRLRLDLEPGDYHAIAYGGIACDEASFGHIEEPGTGSSYLDIRMSLLDGQAGTPLHDHFHGTADFTVAQNSTDYTAVTLPMTKNTNHFRILLQQVSNEPLDGHDFDFIITDANTLFDHANNRVATDPIDYHSYDSGQIIVADAYNRADENGRQVSVAYADLSTSRLFLRKDTNLEPHLKVIHRESGRTIIDLPINTYLLMGKNGRENDWSDQEYLDRCSRWTLTFFLKSDLTWIQTRIIINGWVVRLNNIDA